MKNSEKRKFNIREIFSLDNLVVALISLVVGVLIFLIYFFSRNQLLIDACDGMFIASGVLICVGFLFLIMNQGTFDVIAVGFANLFSVFKKNGTKKYDGIYEYQNIKAEKRRSTRFRFLAILFVGLIFLIIALILWGVFNNSVQ